MYIGRDIKHKQKERVYNTGKLQNMKGVNEKD